LAGRPSRWALAHISSCSCFTSVVAVCQLVFYTNMNECHCVYCTLCSKKSGAKIEITITTTNLIRIKYPLSGFNYHLSGANMLQISTKSIAQFLSNSCLENGTQKQKFPIWKSRLSSSYTSTSVTVCAQTGRRLHRHMRIVEHATVELLCQCGSGRSNATPG